MMTVVQKQTNGMYLFGKVKVVLLITNGTTLNGYTRARMNLQIH